MSENFNSYEPSGELKRQAVEYATKIVRSDMTVGPDANSTSPFSKLATSQIRSCDVDAQYDELSTHFSPNVTMPICDKFRSLIIADFTD